MGFSALLFGATAQAYFNPYTNFFGNADYNRDGRISNVFEYGHHMMNVAAGGMMSAAANGVGMLYPNFHAPAYGQIAQVPSQAHYTEWATNGHPCVWPFKKSTRMYYFGTCATEGLSAEARESGAGWCATGTDPSGQYQYWGFCKGHYTTMGSRCKEVFSAVENNELKWFTGGKCAPKAGFSKAGNEKSWCATEDGQWGDCQSKNDPQD